MDLRRLEVFAKVAELGSFSRAADALFLTQPTVSEHVRALEDELGVQLLDRLCCSATPDACSVSRARRSKRSINFKDA
jgi:DNA-binding transcriptional LysR family regulator